MGKPKVSEIEGILEERSVTTVEHGPGLLGYRVHEKRFSGDQARPKPGDDKDRWGRFDPLFDANDRYVPLLYTASSLTCALHEGLFHDIPASSSYATYDMTRLTGLCVSEIYADKLLTLVSLQSEHIRKFGLERADLIDTLASQYDYSRAWVQAILRMSPGADGIKWTSRRADSAQCFGLFAKCEDSTVDGIRCKHFADCTDQRFYDETIKPEMDRCGILPIDTTRI